MAWSVAEILRVYFEGVRDLRPSPRPSGRPTQTKNRLIGQGLSPPEDLQARLLRQRQAFFLPRTTIWRAVGIK
jgi:hypothetical protein